LTTQITVAPVGSYCYHCIMSKKRARSNKKIFLQKELNTLVVALALATPINLLLSSIMVLSYSFSTSSDGGNLFWAAMAYGILLPILAFSTVRAGIKSRSGVFSSSTLSKMNLAGLLLALLPACLLAPALLLERLGFSIPMTPMYIIFFVYPIGGVILLINRFLALPPPS
jgi:hypothetical protein